MHVGDRIAVGMVGAKTILKFRTKHYKNTNVWITPLLAY